MMPNQAVFLRLRSAVLGAVLVTAVGGCAHTGRNLTPEITHETLENGLEVYLLEDHAAPIFTFQYWSKVGSADEVEGKPGITGLSHFFEHMMFRGTPKHPDYFKAISSRGGKLNAFTWLDVTVYWDKLPKDDLEFVVDIESDRLKNMKIDFLNLEPEREVVKSERLLRTENSPEGALQEAMSATAFTKHSYRWPTVGWMRDLNAITLAEAQAYHERFYVPNNAFIVLVGDFEPPKAMALIRKYYGPFKRHDIRRTPRTRDPLLTHARRTYVEKPTGNGLMMLSCRIPEGASPDFATLEVTDQLLTGGKTSRLQKALVHGARPLASGVGSFVFPFVDPGEMTFNVKLLPGKVSRSAENRITRELARLGEEGVGADELQRAVAQLRAGVVRSMVTTHSRAQMMGFAIRSTGDPATPWKRLAQYGEVTSQDVQRVVNTYLAPQNRVIGNAVDPKQVGTLTAALVKAYPSPVAGQDELVQEATTYALHNYKATHEEAAIAMEREAVRLLGERASLERERLQKAADKEGLAALEKYLAEGEKGPVKRSAKLATREAGMVKTRAALKGQKAGLLARLRTVEQAVGRSKDLIAHWTTRDAWIHELLQGDAGRLRKAVGQDERGLGTWALRSLALQLLYHREVPAVAPVLAQAQPKRGVLLDIWNVAHSAQKVDAGRL